ncbi:MAG: diguanylate cyclase [Polyangiaceae bacterium]|nr:diguanylate cyclase [Polyangiaceae bacterium]
MSQRKQPISTTVQQSGASPISAGSLPKNRSLFTVLTGPEPGRIFALDADELVFGREEPAVGRIVDDGLSRRHARVIARGGSTYIEDLGSTNGTFVGEQRLTGPRKLDDGDRIALGQNVVVKFSLVDALEEEAQRSLYESTVRDPLTRAFNRRYLEERLTSEHSYAARHGSDLTLAMLDIDHFKRINDTWGHAAGDLVLKKVSAAVSRSLRTEDVFARYGGEEFVVVLRGIPPDKALQFAERVRALVEGMAIVFEGHSLPVTTSVGVATMTATRAFASSAELLSAADGALYAAKNAGRNRVAQA